MRTRHGSRRGSILVALTSVFCAAALAGPAAPARADLGTWQTAVFVGASEVDVTIGIECPAATFVCSLIDGYGDTRTSTVIGSGDVEIDEGLAEIRFQTDGLQDVGAGLQPAFITLSGTPLSFTSIPFAGVLQLTNLLTFALNDPPISVPGLAFLPPGDHPFATTLDYGASADVIGDFEFMMNEVVVPEQPAAVSGVFRTLGDVGQDGDYDYEIRDLTATLTRQIAGNIGGEPVTITITTDLFANLRGEVAGAPAPVPNLTPWSQLILALLILSTATFATQFRRRST